MHPLTAKGALYQFMVRKPVRRYANNYQHIIGCASFNFAFKRYKGVHDLHSVQDKKIAPVIHVSLKA